MFLEVFGGLGVGGREEGERINKDCKQDIYQIEQPDLDNGELFYRRGSDSEGHPILTSTSLSHLMHRTSKQSGASAACITSI